MSKEMTDQAFAQEGQERDGAQVPTGDMLGNPETESDRILSILSGQVPSMNDATEGDEVPIGADPQSAGDPEPEPEPEPAEEPESPQDPEPSSDPEEGPKSAFEELFSDSGIEPGGAGESAGQSNYQGQQLQEEWARRAQEVDRREQRLFNLEAVAKRDPMAVLKELGVTEQTVAQQLRQSGFIDDGPPAADPVMPPLSEDADPLTRALYQQNALLKRQIQQQEAATSQLREEFVQDRRYREQESQQSAWEQRRNSAISAAEQMLSSSKMLDPREKALLQKAVGAEIDRSLESAPSHPAGLESWVKGQIRSVMQSAGMDKLQSPTKPKRRSRTPASAGETVGASKRNRQTVPNTAYENDDLRKGGAMNWFESVLRDQ